MATSYFNPAYEKYEKVFIMYQEAEYAEEGTDALVETLKNLVTKDPENLLLRTYLAAAYALDAVQTWSPFKHDKLMSKAFQEIAIVRQNLPKEPAKGYALPNMLTEINILIGTIYVNIPELIYQKGADGYALLKKHIEVDDFSQGKIEFQALGLYNAAKAWTTYNEEEDDHVKILAALKIAKKGRKLNSPFHNERLDELITTLKEELE